MLERALAINDRTLGAEHAATVTVVNNLALLLRDQGDIAAARPLFERAVKGAEKLFGDQHPATAASVGNLALLLKTKAISPARVRFSSARLRSTRRRSVRIIRTPRTTSAIWRSSSSKRATSRLRALFTSAPFRSGKEGWVPIIRTRR